MKYRILVGLVLALAGLAAGLSSIAPPSADVPAAYCVDCQPTNPPCDLGDLTRTSAMDVEYLEPKVSDPDELIEPDDTTSWRLTAYWWSDGATCLEYYEVATVDVTWNGSYWVESNEALPNHIFDIDVCSGDDCSGTSGTHSWNYKLISDVADYVIVGMTRYNLRRVYYATTSVPDGYEIQFNHAHTQCDSLGGSVSPTSQSFGSFDDAVMWGSGRCPFSCDVVGGDMTITYE
jgi:hypothetical protein